MKKTHCLVLVLFLSSVLMAGNLEKFSDNKELNQYIQEVYVENPPLILNPIK